MEKVNRGRVLLVEDEAFTRQLVESVLASDGWSTRGVGTIAEAIASLESFEPHAIVCDLDLGKGPSGVDLCQRIAAERPWIGLVVLSAHASPQLAVSGRGRLPDDVIYLVKSALASPEELSAAIESSIAGRFGAHLVRVDDDEVIEVSAEQAEVLRLIAQAYSNAAIAEARGTSLRAAEAMVQRVFTALGLTASREVNMRVQATRLWDSGRVRVRE